MEHNAAVRLLIAAALMMFVAGCIFGFLHQWIAAVSVGIGSFDCLIAALNFKKQNNHKKGEM